MAASAGTGVLAGHVYLGEGTTVAPVNSVTVEAYSAPYSSGASPAAFAQVGASGEYIISGLLDTDYYLYFDYTGSAGYMSTWYSQPTADFLPEQIVNAQQSTDYIFDQNLLNTPGTITGTVTLPGGAPAGAGDVTVAYAPEITREADVSIQVIGAFSTTTTSTDSDGNYSLSGLLPGNYVLRYTYNGSGNYSPVTYTGSAGFASWATTIYVTPGDSGPTTANQQILPEISISGNAYLGTSGNAPGAGDLTVALTVHDPDTGATISTPSAPVDTSGHYSFSNLADLTAYTGLIEWRPVFSYHGSGPYAGTTTPYVALLTHAGGANYTVPDTIVPAGYSVSGHVYMGDSSRSATAGEVQVDIGSGNPADAPEYSGLTDANGDYSIPNVGVGAYVITMVNLGSEPFATYQVPPQGGICSTECSLDVVANVTGLNGTLIAANSVQGTVRNDADQAVSGATVTATGFDLTSGDPIGTFTTTSAADGTYSFATLPDGYYEIDFQAAGYAFES